MRLRTLSLLILPLTVLAHGDHEHSHGVDDIPDGLDNRAYAQKHMNSEHHIDEFDLESFFNLHDLNNDGFLDIDEIEAIYGLHHPHSMKHSSPESQDSKRQVVTEKVLEVLDTNGDRLISVAEFLAGGIDGLPSFASFKDLGHHYDEESEYFLHHEEIYHSTPETQTDESYNHPEDIEHFEHHAHIEEEEDERERRFEGLPEDADIGSDQPIADPLNQYDTTDPSFDAQKVFPPRPPGAGSSRPQRIDKSTSAREELHKARAEAEGMAGYGEEGYYRPRSASEKMRKGMPYKYKFGNRNEF